MRATARIGWFVRSRACRAVAMLTMVITTAAVAGTILPDTLVISGKDRLIASGKAERFDRSSIFEYSDGGADVYLDGGMAACVVRQYDFRGSVKGSFEVAAYDMQTSLRATGLFQTLSEEHATAMAGTVETMSDVRRCVFHKGGWLVDIVDKSDREVTAGILAKAAAALSASIRGAPGMPPEYSWLPQKEKNAGSERYYYRNFLSRSYLPCALTARYTCGAVPCTLFVSENDSAGSARKGMEKLAASLNAIPRADTIATPSLTAVIKGACIIGVAGEAAAKSVMDLIKACISLVP